MILPLTHTQILIGCLWEKIDDGLLSCCRCIFSSSLRTVNFETSQPNQSTIIFIVIIIMNIIHTLTVLDSSNDDDDGNVILFTHTRTHLYSNNCCLSSPTKHQQQARCQASTQ